MNNLFSPFKINEGRPSTNWRATKYRYWYDNIINLLLVEPQLNQKQIAERLGKHAVTIGMIMNSDLFRARYESRRSRQQEALAETINMKLSNVAITSLDLVQEKMTKSRTALPFEELTDVMTSSLERLGYGSKHQPAVVVNNTQQVVAPISQEDLAASRARIIEHQSRHEVAAPPTHEALVAAPPTHSESTSPPGNASQLQPPVEPADGGSTATPDEEC